MENPYNNHPSVQPVTIAFRSSFYSVKLQSPLLLLSMLLLLSLNSFGQTGVTFTSVNNGPWNQSSTWSSSSGTAGYPQAGSNVKIMNGHTVTINSSEESCSNLTLVGGGGNPKTGGEIVIQSGAKLKLLNLKFSDANGKPKERATLRMLNNSHLTISGEIYKINIHGINESRKDDPNHLDIYYNLSPSSTIEYDGANQAIFNFYALTVTEGQESETSTPYGNVILSKPTQATAATKIPAAGPVTTSDPAPGLKIAGSLTINAGVTFDALALTHSISQNISNAGTIDAKTSTINIGGNFTNTGTFNKGTASIVNYNGANQSVAGVAYHNLIFSGLGTKTAAASLSTASDLNIIPGVTFDANTGVHTIAANLSNAGTINAGSSTIQIGGSFTKSDNSIFNKQTSTIEFNGNAQTITPLSYYNLTLTRSSGTTDVIKTAGGTIFISNNFNVNAGATFAHNGQSFFYDGTRQIQTITPVEYFNLTLGGANTKLSTANLSIKGDLHVYSGVVFSASGNYSHNIAGDLTNDGTINLNNAAGSNEFTVEADFVNKGTFNALDLTHTISGNWKNTFTFNAGTSTIVLDGTYKTISSTGTTGAFNNLTVLNGASSMTSNITVNNELRVESTILQTGANHTLYLGGNANLMSAETATSHIRGNLQTTRNLTSGNTGIFGNIGIRISNYPSSIADVTVKRVTGTAFKSPVNGNTSVLRQFYITTPAATPSSLFKATMEMRFPDYDLGGSAEEIYDIFRLNLDNTIDLLTKAEATDPTRYNYKLDNADRKYGMYTLANRITPLPVELSRFKAQRQAQGVLLTWETASEKENKGFEIQVSSNGKSFSKVAFVESKVINSSVAQRYSYTDNATLGYGTRYYRLAQVDLDGTTTYSNIRAVNMDAAIVAAAAYPNPFAEGQQVTVRLPQGGESRQVRLVLTNTIGQVVLEQQAQVHENQVELPVNTAKANAKGLYLLNVIDNGTKYTFKLIKK